MFHVYIYIYIYIYTCVCVCVCVCLSLRIISDWRETDSYSVPLTLYVHKLNIFVLSIIQNTIYEYCKLCNPYIYIAKDRQTDRQNKRKNRHMQIGKFF